MSNISYDEWPIQWKKLSRFRKPADKGIGDTLKRQLDYLGGEQIAEILKRIIGKDCECSDRQEYLNQLYPYTEIKDA